MDTLTYYSIGFTALWIVPVLPRLYALFQRHVIPRFHSYFARARYQRIHGFTRLGLFRGSTRLEILLIVLYIAGNGTAVALEATRETTIASSAALASTINLVPLLLGGRTSRVADVVGVSRPSYYVAHFWIGRIAVLEALVHAGIHLVATVQAQAFEPVAISGCITAASFFAILKLSVPCARCALGGEVRGIWRILYGPALILTWPCARCTLGGASRGVHRILYLAGMGGLVWHVLLVQSLVHEVLVFVACGLWLLSHAWRVVARWRTVTVEEKWTDGEVTRLHLKTQRPVSTFPGSYFYLYLPGSYLNYDMLRNSAVMMLWSDAKQSVTGKTTDFHVLAGGQSRHLRLLRTVENRDRLLLDGPYGQDLRLREYETVILTAKGIGIVSILPMALHLAARKDHDDSVRSKSNPDSDPTIGIAADPAAAPVFRDATRRIDLLWRLEHNDQELWVADQLKALQNLDPRQVVFLVWCIYPNPQTRPPPFEETPHWSAVYPQEGQSVAQAEAPYSFEKALSHEVLLPGKCIVVACGDRPFTDERRASVIRNTSKEWPIEFIEAEYRPGNGERDSFVEDRPNRRPRAVSMMRLRRNRHQRRASYGSNVPLRTV